MSKMVVDCPLAITSMGETLFHTWPDKEKGIIGPTSLLHLYSWHWVWFWATNSETCSKSKIPLIVTWCFSSDDLLPLIKNSFGIYYVFLANNNSFQKGTHIFISQCAKFVKVFLVRLTLQRYLFLSYTVYVSICKSAHSKSKSLFPYAKVFAKPSVPIYKYLFPFSQVSVLLCKSICLLVWFPFANPLRPHLIEPIPTFPLLGSSCRRSNPKGQIRRINVQ